MIIKEKVYKYGKYDNNMKISIILVMLPFILGFAISQVTSNTADIQMPFSESKDVASPYDRIKEDQILVYDSKVVIQIKDASLAEYADTNSMDPFIDSGSNGIEIIPESEEDLHVGDVVTYESDIGLIVHRIVNVEYDREGKYFVLKGDNNATEDPYKVRFNQVRYILVGVIY